MPIRCGFGADAAKPLGALAPGSALRRRVAFAQGAGGTPMSGMLTGVATSQTPGGNQMES